MVARYELVAVDEHKNGHLIVSKKGPKLTLQEIDLFTTLFKSSEEMTLYLDRKNYLNGIKPVKYVALYTANKAKRYVDCCYKEDQDIISLAISSKETNKVNIYNSASIKLINTLLYSDGEMLDFLYENKYINDHIYQKMLEYKASYTGAQRLQLQIERELTKEYLQIRKLYSGIKAFRKLCDEKHKER